MTRRNCALITEEEIDLGPVDAIPEALSRQQLINSSGRIAAGEPNTEHSAILDRFRAAFNKPFSRRKRKLFCSVEN